MLQAKPIIFLRNVILTHNASFQNIFLSSQTLKLEFQSKNLNMQSISEVNPLQIGNNLVSRFTFRLFFNISTGNT